MTAGVARWFLLLVAVAWLGGCPGWAEESPTLESAVAEALARSAELSSLRAQTEAAEAMIAPAGALPDPMLSVGLKNIPADSWRLDQDAMSGLEIMLSQEVPRSTKRRLRQGVQGGEVAMVRARYEDKRLDIVRRAKQAYLDVQSVDAQMAIAEQNRDLAQDMLSAAEAAYGTGKVMQQEVFQAQVRLSQMVDMVISLQGERAGAQARLNRLLYRPPEQPFPELPAPKLTAVSLAGKALVGQAERDSPRLAEMRARVGQTEQSESLAAEEIKPDYRLDFAYMIREPVGMDPMSGTDMWSAGVGINLPWFRRRQTVDEEVRAARAMRLAAEQDVEAMRNELGAMIEEMVVEVGRADKQLSLLDSGLLPQAEGAFAASLTSYGTGQGDIMDLLANQMNLYNLQVQRVMLVAERERNLAELEYLVGGPLTPPEVKLDAQ